MYNQPNTPSAIVAAHTSAVCDRDVAAFVQRYGTDVGVVGNDLKAIRKRLP